MLGSLHRLHREPVFYLIAMRKVGLVLRFKESCESLVCHVNVELGDELERSVHRENGNAYVDNINVKVCDILCNRSAAAGVNRAELAELPIYVRAVENSHNIADQFCTCVRGAALASCTRILRDNDASVKIRSVSCIERSREGRVKCRIDIGGEAL